MEAIFAAKLYRTSNRKAKIASALADPVNMELVQQLTSYLADEPEETKEPEVIEVSVDDDVLVKKPEPKEVHEVINPETDSSSSELEDSANTDPEAETPSLEQLIVDEKPDDNESSDTDLSDSNSADNEDSVGVESSRSESSVFHSPRSLEVSVDSSTTIPSCAISSSICDKIRVDAAAIKGTLNMRDDTRGVSRIFVRDDELWIYYQDKVNLNSVMEPVIALLNSAGFTNLEFNRLARTENAIVFEISCVYNDIQPVKDEA